MICINASIFLRIIQNMTATSEVLTGYFLILDVHWSLAGHYFELSLQHD